MDPRLVGCQPLLLLGQDGLAPLQPRPQPPRLQHLGLFGGQGLPNLPHEYRGPEEVDYVSLEGFVEGLHREDLPPVPDAPREGGRLF